MNGANSNVRLLLDTLQATGVVIDSRPGLLHTPPHSAGQRNARRSTVSPTTPGDQHSNKVLQLRPTCTNRCLDPRMCFGTID